MGGERVTARTRILDVMWNGSPVAPQLDLISKPNSKLATGGGPLSGDRRIHYIRTDIRGNLVKETECSTAATVRQPRTRYRFSARRVSLSAQTLEETSAVSRGPAVVAKGAKHACREACDGLVGGLSRIGTSKVLRSARDP